MDAINHREIINLEDQNLKLRYILGGLFSYNKEEVCNRYWSCDIKCSAFPVLEDNNLEQIKNFINKHNFDTTAFLEIAYSYLRGGFCQVNGAYGPLIEELENVLKGYNCEAPSYDEKNEVILRDSSITKYIEKNYQDTESELYNFLEKYHLTETDFIVLVKTRLNYGFYKCHGFLPSEFYQELTRIVKDNFHLESYETVEELKRTNKTIKKAKIYK